MKSRLCVFAALAAVFLCGCATVDNNKEVSKKGDEVSQKETKKCSGWGCATADQIIIVPSGYGYGRGYDAGAGRGYYQDYRGRPYRGSYPIGEGQACSGPFGQTWHGICYPERPPWPLN